MSWLFFAIPAGVVLGATVFREEEVIYRDRPKSNQPYGKCDDLLKDYEKCYDGKRWSYTHDQAQERCGDLMKKFNNCITQRQSSGYRIDY
jgi:hypothetical protein